MPSSHRCVFGCVTTGVTIHKFPNPVKYPELFRTWVGLAAESLRDMTDEVIYKNRNVCDKHFAENVKNRNSRLNRLAIPTLHLPNDMQVDRNLCDVIQQPVRSSGLENSYTTDSMLAGINNDHSYFVKPGKSCISKTSQIENSMLAGINNDHSYFVKPGKSCISKTSQIENARIYSPKLACYTDTERKLKRLKSEICRLKKRSQNYKTRLAVALKLSNDKALQKVTDRMSLPAKLFTNIQFRETPKKPKGHRFTNEEKILALSFYKRSPKCYSLLSKCFTLPSSKSLKNLLTKIKLAPGINQIIFKKLKDTVKDMEVKDRLCTLIFDEMSINPQVQYNVAQDELKGFTTIGDPNIADHVLTFMIRGVKKNFKQPVAYYFTSCLKKLELKNCIKEVIESVVHTGLIIIATVCDQSAINVSAIESLVEDAKTVFLKKGLEWRRDIILIGGRKIIPLFDAPHLIKGIRNNLITKDLSYIDPEDGKRKIVKWEYFEKLYHADETYGELKLLHKLTDEHINPQKINKMRVKSATQLFSRSVAAAAKHLVDSGKLGAEFLNIVPFVQIMDKLFDSLNSNTFQPVDGKLYRAGVKVDSPHHKLWQECILFLKNMKYLQGSNLGNKFRLTEKTVPSIKNFIKTLEGMQSLWQLLNRKYGLDIILCRHFNQDPIENFFGNIRSLGVRNVAPNTVAFEAAFKALLLNNFCSSHSIRANCEDDMSTYLQTVDFLIKFKSEDKKIENLPENIIINERILSSETRDTTDAGSYVCGWVLKKCLIKIIKGCNECKNELMSNENLYSNTYIRTKEYKQNKKWLCYPSSELKQCFNEIQNVATSILKEKNSPKNIKATIKFFNEFFVNFDIFKCKIHKNELCKYFEDTSINIILYSWCRSVNRILCGKISYDGNDETKTKAQIYYNVHKHNKNRK